MPTPNVFQIDDLQVLFLDLQEQIVRRSKTTSPKALEGSAVVLAQLARLFSLPVTVSVVPEENKDPVLIKGLGKELAGAPQFLRTGASPFLDPPTVAALAAHERKTLVIGGFATEVVVLHAVTGAIDAGYRVVVAVDACGGMSERTEDAALRQIQRFGADISSVVTIATTLAPDFTTDLGRKMFEIVQQLRLE